jgi:hypothetical protein
MEAAPADPGTVGHAGIGKLDAAVSSDALVSLTAGALGRRSTSEIVIPESGPARNEAAFPSRWAEARGREPVPVRRLARAYFRW